MYTGPKFGVAIVLLACGPTAGAEEQDDVIAQVIVTAERRSMDVQAVPSSVYALTEDELRSAGWRDTVDLTAAVPGLQFDQQAMGATPFIRGVGAMSGAIGNESPVSVYVDGVYIAAPTAAVASLHGVRQVEVLKGPQGTLFGRNATGGVIQIETRDPAPDPSGELQVQLSNYRTTQGSLYATAGVGSVAANLSLYRRKQQRGWGHNLATGAATFRHEQSGARTKLAWTPAPQTRLVFAASYFDRSGEDGIGYHPLPGSLAADGHTGYPGFYNSWADPQDRAGYRHAVSSARLEQEFAAFRLVNILSWQSLHAFFRIDQDATPARIVDAPVSQYGRTVTEELQAVSHADAAWPWIVGVYYLNDLSAYDPVVLEGAVSVPFSATEIRSQQRSASYAIYGQFTMPLAARTDLAIGARHTRDERRVAGTTVGVLDADRTTLAAARQRDVWNKPTWRVALSHDLAEEVMVYGSWDRGFKSGVYNLLTYAFPAVNPESLDAFQAGLKSEWLQRRLRLNVAGFVYRYRNIQVESVIAGATVAMNAAAARVRGLEVDLEYLPSSRLRLRAGLALLHGRYTDFRNAVFSTPNRDAAGNLRGGNVVVAGDASGHRTVRSPGSALTLDGRYRVPTRVGELGLGVTFAYRSRFAWDPDNRLEERARGLLNASIDWQSSRDVIAVRVSANNLTNAKTCLYGYANVLGDFCAPRAPRVLSIDLSAKF